ncbi:MAG TPA: M48 family metallopeptidase [Gemmatimonadales bacterium]|nr:M48 family metallopeptidase [Gemmatimonadales bacterium]
MADENLWAQQADNRRKSAWLVAGFILFFAWLGFGGDWVYYLHTRALPADQYHHVVPWFGILLSLAGAGLCWYAWHNGADRVLWATGAREVTDPATDQEKMLVNVVQEMAIAASIPMPRVWIVPDPDPNAFATGNDPATASIAVTQGLLDTLSRDELQAVVAHEMAHVRNLDVRLMTLLAAIVGAVALMSQGAGRWLGFGGGGRGRDDEGKGAGPLAIVVLVLWVVSLIVAPIVTRLLAMAVSRKREFLADATGAQFTRNPLALASALEKLDAASAPTRSIASGAAHLCIVDPAGSALNDQEGATADFLGSHPPTRIRIARLRGMGYQQMKRDGVPIPDAGAA